MSEATITQGGNTEGQVDQQPSNAGTETPQTPAMKLFTQDELNTHIQSRLAEQQSRWERKHQKELSDALAKKDAELTAAIEAAVAERLAARELESAKASVIKEYGLNEKQAAALNGTTADELTASAEELFGKLRKAPPTIQTGSDSVQSANAPVIYTREQLRDSKFYVEHKADILVAAREGRIVG